MSPRLIKAGRRSLPTLLGLAGLAIATTGAQAHPHVWITATAAVETDDQDLISALSVRWTFDEFYSAFATDDADADRDGHLDAAELQSMAETFAANLVEWLFFTEVKVDGVPVAHAPVTYYAASVQDDLLTFDFRLPLAAPVNPRLADVTFAMFDPSYYIAIELASQTPVSLANSGVADCAVGITEAGSTAANEVPLSEAIFQALDTSSSIARMFAETVTLRCQ